MPEIAIIIPCYNEEKRLPKDKVFQLVSQTEVDIFLANDGSRDGTVSLLREIEATHPGRCHVIDFENNRGKANTIYHAVHQLLNQNRYDFIGYFDADFSTPVDEVVRILSAVGSGTEFVIGSRVQLLNSGIERKYYRHIIGRVIITLINLKFKLGIYDTQCGAKIFSSEILKKVFDEPFSTSWLFDVEIFIRMKKQGLLSQGKELPIYNWRDVEGSKLNWKSGWKILNEVRRLVIRY